VKLPEQEKKIMVTRYCGSERRPLGLALKVLRDNLKNGFRWESEDCVACYHDSREQLTFLVGVSLRVGGDVQAYAEEASAYALAQLAFGAALTLRHEGALKSLTIKTAIRRGWYLAKRDRRYESLDDSDVTLIGRWRPCDDAREREYKDHAMWAFSQLAPQYRRVIELSFRLWNDIDAIANELRISRQVARLRLSRAQRAWQELLGIAPVPQSRKKRCSKPRRRCS
jgi:DNA-directed RNA polymerase specialized sigma24 family protein